MQRPAHKAAPAESFIGRGSQRERVSEGEREVRGSGGSTFFLGDFFSSCSFFFEGVWVNSDRRAVEVHANPLSVFLHFFLNIIYIAFAGRSCGYLRGIRGGWERVA
jgi:hypothetical protein